MIDVETQLSGIPFLSREERLNFLASSAADRWYSLYQVGEVTALENVTNVEQTLFEFAEWLDDSSLIDDMIWEQLIKYLEPCSKNIHQE